MAKECATIRSPNFNFTQFICSWFPEGSYFDASLRLPHEAHHVTRREIEAIVARIDIISVEAIFLYATIDHPRHIGSVVSAHCKAFSNTNRRLWNAGDAKYKFAGDIKRAIAALDIHTVERLLVDATLTFQNVATRVAAARNQCSKELDKALNDIQDDYKHCRYFIRVMSGDWNDFEEDQQAGFARIALSKSTQQAAEDLASCLANIQTTVTRTPCWQTRRDTLVVLQKIMRYIIEELQKCEEFFWGNLISALMSQTVYFMTWVERCRYIHEGFYASLIRVYPYLPEKEADTFCLLFPLNSGDGGDSHMVRHSQEEELDRAKRTIEARYRQPELVAPDRSNSYAHSCRANKR